MGKIDEPVFPNLWRLQKEKEGLFAQLNQLLFQAKGLFHLDVQQILVLLPLAIQWDRMLQDLHRLLYIAIHILLQLLFEIFN